MYKKNKKFSYAFKTSFAYLCKSKKYTIMEIEKNWGDEIWVKWL
ncbi:hypothetical protein CDSM653_01004 [Caldanaerobacter subterraneus subsp. pacificus DSM 12653]|uniref:Uncharacterized protein n=1 Tax=Caldanaerobacter subterraneus subsp. pacificus DSM 12653 TaxID=391606 RepID=A0A0F5PMY8_9THEO|nr:hypothetical protein CDSM653_01004 [Caldanaerobacter subterraneus subsp. pacificus DSM 12653]